MSHWDVLTAAVPTVCQHIPPLCHSNCLSTHTTAVVQAFISCRLDYCNSVLAGVAGVYLQRLQSVQNAAARLVCGVRRHDHITPVRVSLHWLPVRQRIIYKTVVLVWKWLSTWCSPSLFGWRDLLTRHTVKSSQSTRHNAIAYIMASSSGCCDR